MERKGKVNILLIVVAVIAILFAIFALSRSGDTKYIQNNKKYEDNIRNLNDTIKSLKGDIAKYQYEINRLDLERVKIRKELELIIRDNEKIDAELANGSWDDNIKFLTDYLSKADSMGGRHGVSNNKDSDDNDK